MRKRLKPQALDVELIGPEQKQCAAATASIPGSLPSMYASLIRHDKWPGDAAHRPAGLSGLVFSSKRVDASGAGSCDASLGPEVDVDMPIVLSKEANPCSIKEGTMVRLRAKEDGRFAWKPRMTDALSLSMQGEVRCIDTECCQVRVLGQVHWLPACCLNPVASSDSKLFALRGGGSTDGLTEGLLVLLRPDAKATMSVSPFPWTPALEKSFKHSAEPGTVLRVMRAVNASCRVQFGGYLWSLPLSCLEVPTPRGTPLPRRLDTPPSVYVATYRAACEKHACKPNSALLKLLQKSTLSVLDLSDNYLGEKGLRCLAEVLQANHSITDVLLSHNSLVHEDIVVVLDVVKECPLVRYLDLSHNPLNMLTGRHLKKVLEGNRLLRVHVGETNIPDSIVAELAQISARNAAAPSDHSG